MQSPDSNLHMYNDITHMVGFTEHSLTQVLIASGFKKFFFQGFEEFVFGGAKEKFKKFLRYIYWKWVRFVRRINSNLNPIILHPVLSVIAEK